MKKAFIFLFFLLCCTINTLAQKDTIYSFGDNPNEADYFFGFNLVENGSGGMAHLALVKPNKNGKPKIMLLTKDAFVKQAKGLQESLANPLNLDFFEKYDIKDPDILDDLWRLRYVEYPYKTQKALIIERHHLNDSTANAIPTMNTSGWSANDSIPFIPTKSQMLMLKKFGMKRMNDFVYGENAFKLLKSMQNPQWVSKYKTSYE